MRQTTRSRAYSFRKAIFAPAPRRWALTRFPRSFANWTVLGKKDRRLLEVAAAVPWFWRKDCQSLPTFVSFVYVSMGGMSGKHSAELKTPRRRGQHLRWWNQRQSERFYQTSAESLEVAFTVRSFLRRKSKKNFFYASLYKMIRVKKCETTGFESGKSRSGLLYVTLHCWPCLFIAMSFRNPPSSLPLSRVAACLGFPLRQTFTDKRRREEKYEKWQGFFFFFFGGDSVHQCGPTTLIINSTL